MKLINLIKCLLTTALLATVLPGATAWAQMPNPAAGMNTLMTKLFGIHTAFVSKAEIRVLDKSQRETTVVPMNFDLLDGKLRIDIDMNQMRSAQIPGDAVASLKRMRMDQLATIVRPDRKLKLLIYPLLQAYAQVPMDKDELADLDRKYKIEKTRLGHDSIDGHACEKNNVVMTDDKGLKQTAIVWYATDLKDFPIQMQMTDGDNTMVIKFNDLKLARPDANRFEAPAGFTKYDSPEKLMRSITLK